MKCECASCYILIQTGQQATHLKPDSPTTMVVIGIMLITFDILCSIFLIAFALVVRGRARKKTKFYFDRLPKTVEEIPSHYHFSRWMPTIVEGLWTCYLVRREGAQALIKLAESCGTIFDLAVLHKRVLVVRDPTLLQVVVIYFFKIWFIIFYMLMCFCD